MSELALPEEWGIVPLVQCLDKDSIISDGDWVESKDQDVNGSVRLIQLADIGDGYFRNKSNRFMNTADAERLNCTYLKEGDVLVARMPDPLGRACLFPNINQEAVTVVDVCLIRVGSNSAIYSKLLRYWINSPAIRNKIAMNATGTTRKRITRKKLEKFEFPVPSKPEQEAIVNYLDTYLTTVSQIQARLDAIPKLIEKFRQSVVRDAVSGELVNYKSELNKVETISLEEVVVSSMNGLSKRSGDSGEAEVVLRLADFKDSKRVYGGERKIRLTPKELEKYRINNEDILIVRVNGSVDLAGKFILYKEEDHPEAFCDHFIKLTLDSDRVRPEFVVLIANEGEGRYYLKNSLSTSAGQNTINQKSVKGLELKLPPLEIQDKIIKKVNFLFAYADQIEKSVAIAKARVDNLTQSILHQAFTGQLTKEWREQNPELISGDNSAEALLAKIEAEKKASGKKGKAKK